MPESLVFLRLPQRVAALTGVRGIVTCCVVVLPRGATMIYNIENIIVYPTIKQMLSEIRRNLHCNLLSIVFKTI